MKTLLQMTVRTLKLVPAMRYEFCTIFPEDHDVIASIKLFESDLTSVLELTHEACDLS